MTNQTDNGVSASQYSDTLLPRRKTQKKRLNGNRKKNFDNPICKILQIGITHFPKSQKKFKRSVDCTCRKVGLMLFLHVLGKPNREKWAQLKWVFRVVFGKLQSYSSNLVVRGMLRPLLNSGSV